MQPPVLVRVTLAEDLPFESIDWLPIEQFPEALKLTSKKFAMLLVSAVALTESGEFESTTELGKESRTMD